MSEKWQKSARSLATRWNAAFRLRCLQADPNPNPKGRSRGRFAEGDLRTACAPIRRYRIWRPIFLAVIVTLACTIGSASQQTTSLPSTPTIQAATPLTIQPPKTPTPTPTLTLTLTPTPTHTPTPTPFPAVRLTDAERFVHDGDYASAIAEYQSVLTGTGSTDEIEEAQFGLGEAALRQGDLVAAENALTQFIAAYPDSTRLADAWFLLAETRFASGNYTGAVDAYRTHHG